jgi:hypothetical protein
MADDKSPTHVALVKKHYGNKKKLFTWLEIGKGRLNSNGSFDGLLDRMPIGGFTGYIHFARIGQQPPEPEPERPDADTGDDEEA